MARKRIDSVSELKEFYYLYGDEELLARQALDRLKKLFASQADADFNVEVLSAPEVGVERIIDAAETVPLMADRRLVVATDVTLLPRKDQTALADYLDRANPGTTLVLVAHMPGPGEPADAGVIKKAEASPIFKKASRPGAEALRFTLGRGKRQKLTEWVTAQFEKRGKSVEAPAREMLIEKVGRQLRDLDGAIERVALFAADRPLVTVADVTRVVAPAAERGIFELVDAVAERRRDASLNLLNHLLRQGESPQHVLNMLLRQFRLVSRCKSLSADHDYGSLASELKVPPFLVGKCVQQSKRFSAERLRRAFSEFKRAQVEMHSSRYLPDTDYQGHVLETMITRIIG